MDEELEQSGESLNERNVSLARLAKEGDLQAQNELILANSGLVHKIANTYARNEDEREEYYQEGICGLIRAIRNYDESRGTFSTHASLWVKAAILKCIKNKEVFHYNDAFYAKYLKYKKMKAASNGLDDDFTPEELKKYGLTQKDVDTVRKYARSSCSLEAAADSPWPSKIAEVVRYAESADDVIIRNETVRTVLSEMERLLSPKEFFVICHAYGIGGGGEMKMARIAGLLAKEFGGNACSRQRVQQIKTSAENKLRNSRKLRQLVDNK